MALRRIAPLVVLLSFVARPDGRAKDAPAPPKDKPEPAKPTSHTAKTVEGWTVRVDDRLLKAPDAELGTRALRFLEGKLGDIKVVVPADKVKKLQAVTIVLDLTHGHLGPMQYHPDAGWLKANGYAAETKFGGAPRRPSRAAAGGRDHDPDAHVVRPALPQAG